MMWVVMWVPIWSWSVSEVDSMRRERLSASEFQRRKDALNSAKRSDLNQDDAMHVK